MWRCADEAEHVAILVSEWLELDAPDDWVRHDSEIVRPTPLVACFILAPNSSMTLAAPMHLHFPLYLPPHTSARPSHVGSASRTGLCVLPQRAHSHPATTAESRTRSVVCACSERSSRRGAVHAIEREAANLRSFKNQPRAREYTALGWIFSHIKRRPTGR